MIDFNQGPCGQLDKYASNEDLEKIYSTWFYTTDQDAIGLMSTNPLTGQCINDDVLHEGSYLRASFVVCFHKHVSPIGKRVVEMACFLLSTLAKNTPRDGFHYSSVDEWVSDHEDYVDSPGFEFEFPTATEEEIVLALELIRFSIEATEWAEYDDYNC